MHRIDDPSAASALPTPAAAGTPGYFTRGNPGTGTPATIVSDDWANAVQEEMAAVIEAAGLTLNKASHTQLLAALGSLYGGGGSVGANGWQRLPGGLILQWGSATGPVTGTTNSTVSVTFPLAFPTEAYPVVANASNAATPAGWPPVIFITSLTTTGFNLGFDLLGGGGTQTITVAPTGRWLALGK